MINKILELMLGVLNNGIDKVIGVTLFIASCLAGIDFILSILYEWSDNFTQVIKMFWKKIINYAFIFAVIKNWKIIMNETLKMTFGIGYLFFPQEWVKSLNHTSNVELPDLDGVYNILMENVLLFSKKMFSLSIIHNIGTILIMLIIIVVLVLCNFMIIKELVIQTVQFYVAACIGVILLIFSTFEQTKSMGSKIFNTLLNTCMSLLTTLALTGVALYAIKSSKDIVASVETGDVIQLGDMLFYMFLMLLIAYLVNCSKEFANGIMSGNVSGAGGGTAILGAIGKVAVGAAATVATAGATAVGIKGALDAYKTAKEAGVSGIMNKAKVMSKGAKNSIKAFKGGRIGKLGSAAKKGVENLSKVASGQMGLGDFLGATVKGTGGAIKDQVTHDSAQVKIEKDMAKELDAENMTVSQFASELSEDEIKDIEKEWNEASENSAIKQTYKNLDNYVKSKKFEKAFSAREGAKKAQKIQQGASEYAHYKAKMTGQKDKDSISKFKDEYIKNYTDSGSKGSQKQSGNGYNYKQSDFGSQDNSNFNDDSSFNDGSSYNNNSSTENGNASSGFSDEQNTTSSGFKDSFTNNAKSSTHSNKESMKNNFSGNVRNNNVPLNKTTFSMSDDTSSKLNDIQMNDTRNVKQNNGLNTNVSQNVNAYTDNASMKNNFNGNVRNNNVPLNETTYSVNTNNNTNTNINTSTNTSTNTYSNNTSVSNNNASRYSSSVSNSNNVSTPSYSSNEPFTKFDNSYNKYEEETFIKALNTDPMTTVSMATDKMKDSTTFMGRAVAKNGKTLQFASDKLKNDAWIVKRAIKNDPTAIQFASDELKNNPEIQQLAKEIAASKKIEL
ncbi:DUF4116 domain-containing protein [uncultured Sneathia sp.]|uniref:DUF4116 domain-containing protein n=1 Tax=uncultured Sneathia sp. TaxID=278067 RepID=UPI00259B3806|nr:DUF4116 domain-containing protein [uncultured Sneathia sp.]